MMVKWIKQSDGSVNDITNFISTVDWNGSASQASRMLEISTINSPHDKNIRAPNIKLGDRLKLYSDDKKVLIDVMVYNRERNSDAGTITYDGYDNLNHLLKSNGTYNFKNTTPEKIAKKICDDLKVGIGNLSQTKVTIPSLLIDGESFYDIMMKAYTKAHNSLGKKYMPIMFGKKLNVIEKGAIVENFILNDKVDITSSSYTESLDDMINKVKIYNEKGKQIGEIKNDNWIKKYGVFQDVYDEELGVNSTTVAKNMLMGITKDANVEALGNVYCISGYGIKIKDSITGLTGTFWIEDDSHTWENGIHTMSLGLVFKNIMDTQDSDDTTDETKVYVGGSGLSFHIKSSCSNIKNIKTYTKKEAIDKKYKQCLKCF